MKEWGLAPTRGRTRTPTYHAGIADHELIVLSYPQAIDAAQYQRFNDGVTSGGDGAVADKKCPHQRGNAR
ncbi:Uncharacterised protein [Kluyvera cryocrescens]|uniref:Uncharacterized protein n=1 Tax=Kluyvera cryocrescens TaxID=580 RepID=A0A485BB70_KLUCR|nr:Uncharacterised protein [Kluyvera cryocrescens]